MAFWCTDQRRVEESGSNEIKLTGFSRSIKIFAYLDDVFGQWLASLPLDSCDGKGKCIVILKEILKTVQRHGE